MRPSFLDDLSTAETRRAQAAGGACRMNRQRVTACERPLRLEDDPDYSPDDEDDEPPYGEDDDDDEGDEDGDQDDDEDEEEVWQVGVKSA
jgi:hypothetical protein